MVAGGAELARDLRERRRAEGLTRMRLAERCGFATVDLAKWERGEDLPDPGQIAVLAAAVGLDDNQTQVWLDAAATVVATRTEPGVAAGAAEKGEPRVNPLRQGQHRTDLRRRDGIRPRLVELSGTDPSAVTGRPMKPPPPRPAPNRRTGLVTKPAGQTVGELPSVFPDTRAYDPAVRVYSTTPSTYPGPGDERLYLLRRISAASVLLGLGIILLWAFGALGEGIGDVLDLFRAPGDSSLVP